jgi:hypothetical protein
MRRLLVLLVFFATMASSVPAYAWDFYWSVGQEGTGQPNNAGIWWGVQADNYVFSPTDITNSSDGIKVNAILGQTYDGRQMVEAGWCKHGPSGALNYFYSYKKNGTYYGPYHCGSATAGNRTLKLYWAGSDYWQYYVDNSAKATYILNPYITSAVVGTQAEVHFVPDNNYAHFWNLKQWDKNSRTWKAWTKLYPLHLDPYHRGTGTTQDHYYPSKVTNTDWYSKHQ